MKSFREKMIYFKKYKEVRSESGLLLLYLVDIAEQISV